MSVIKASSSTRCSCTTDTVCGRLTRFRIWVSRVAWLSVTIECPGSGALSAELNKDVGTSVAPGGRFALPEAVLLVGVVAAVSTTPSERAPSMMSILNADFYATSNERAIRGIFRANTVVAIDGAQIIREVVPAGLEVVLNLNDTSGSDLILGQVTKLDGDASTDGFTIDHAMGSDGIGRNGDNFVVFAFKTGTSRANGPRVDIVGTMVHKVDVVVCRGDIRQNGDQEERPHGKRSGAREDVSYRGC